MESENIPINQEKSVDLYFESCSEYIEGLYWPALVSSLDPEFVCSTTLFLADPERVVGNQTALVRDLIGYNDFNGFPLQGLFEHGDLAKGGVFVLHLEATPLIIFQMFAMEKENLVNRYLNTGVRYLNEDAKEKLWNYLRNFSAMLYEKGYPDVAKQYFTRVFNMVHCNCGITDNANYELAKSPYLWDISCVRNSEKNVYLTSQFQDRRESSLFDTISL